MLCQFTAATDHSSSAGGAWDAQACFATSGRQGRGGASGVNQPHFGTYSAPCTIPQGVHTLRSQRGVATIPRLQPLLRPPPPAGFVAVTLERDQMLLEFMGLDLESPLFSAVVPRNTSAHGRG